MTNNSSHPTQDDDSDELDTGVDLQRPVHLDTQIEPPYHVARVAAADGGKTSPALVGVASLIGFVIGAGVYGFAQSAHSKDHTPAAQLMKIPAPTKLADAPTTTAAEAKKETDEPETKAATPSDNEDTSSPESQMLETARAELSSGDAAAALTSLEHMRKRFPKGSLAQERELLRIEALKAKGQRTAAKTAARKFAKAHPNNPRLSELESLLLGP
jgi:TolA-binding protein